MMLTLQWLLTRNITIHSRIMLGQTMPELQLLAIRLLSIRRACACDWQVRTV
jgi:hypothetical protein